MGAGPGEKLQICNNFPIDILNRVCYNNYSKRKTKGEIIMVFLTILIIICAAVAFITDFFLNYAKKDYEVPMTLILFLSIIIGSSAIIVFITGHFLGA